ncbi:M50 family metallopeptidase [Shewanella algae]|uniref:M50 family metallopeptidase n=1 Tax=Shewanella algae TaxID=38313 RepID=UPI001AAF1261|nr:M50 family metallopeptidase [Shewanella algae]MBO2591214.1 M50 family metallopeptidase [Shewanella algae]
MSTPDSPAADNAFIKPSHSLLLPGRGQFLLELLLALMLTHLPYVSVPFKWLESYFHELSHALATLLSGGIVSHIQLFPSGAGFCFSQGGWPLLIGFSGYLGAAFWGCLLYHLATWPRGIRISFAFIGALVLLTILLWGRDVLTLSILISLSVLFLLPLKFGGNRLLSGSLRLVALMVMLNALASPAVLLGLDDRGDAVLLAEYSWVPAFVWVLLWFASGLLALLLCWRRIDGKSN